MGIRSSRAAQTRGVTCAWAASPRRRGARLTTCGLAACAALLIGAGPAQAVNYIVDSTGDGSDVAAGNGLCATVSATCTLRAAMEDAQALGGTNTITLVGLPDPSTIDLGSALPTISGQTLTITGAGQDALTVRRVSGGDYPIFTTNASDVSIAGMTITNGRAVPQGGPVLGGGIYSVFGSLELDRRRGRRQRCGDDVIPGSRSSWRGRGWRRPGRGRPTPTGGCVEFLASGAP